MEKAEIKEIAKIRAEKICNGKFPIEYTREQVAKHTTDDFIAGYEYAENQIKALSAIKRGLEKSLDECPKTTLK